MKLEFSWKIFEKYSNIKFYGYPSIGGRVFPCELRRTSMTKIIVTFRNFANAPRKGWYVSLPLEPVLNTHIQSHIMDIKHSRPAFQNFTRTVRRLQILTNSVDPLRKIILNRRPQRQKS
jgi:hypothetical protein